MHKILLWHSSNWQVPKFIPYILLYQNIFLEIGVMQGIATEAIPCKMTCKALYMEEERAEGSCFLMVLCTEDQSSSQSSSTHVALALHGHSSQPFSQCTLFARTISSFSCKCWHSSHLFPSVPFSELEFSLTPVWIRLRQMWLHYFFGCSVVCSSIFLIRSLVPCV